MNSEALTKVYIDLPNHWAVGGESMWAHPLGDDVYEIRNVPFYAYGLNFLDVVKAVPASPDLKPSVVSVVRASGHRTLRVMFPESTPESQCIPLLESLRDLGASLEGATKRFFAIDIETEGDYQGVCDRLFEWEKEGVLSYETCEGRVEGSFDDRPRERADSTDAG
jgi:hypothetical protein